MSAIVYLMVLFVHLLNGPLGATPFPNRKLAMGTNGNDTSKRVRRIVNSHITSENEVPYHVIIFTLTNLTTRNLCGGSLISLTYVLTAAHCLQSAHFGVFLKLGTSRLSGRKAASTKIMYSNKFRIFDGFVRILDDIGLVELPRPVVPSPYIQIVSLPTMYDAARRSYDFESGMICGHGTVDRSYLWDPDAVRLQEMYLHCGTAKVSYSDCVMFNISLPTSLLCMTGIDHFAAQPADGDSGGGFVINGVLVGIISVKVLTYGPFGPALFVRVASYLTWIANNTNIELS